jgi:hypothetical protein
VGTVNVDFRALPCLLFIIALCERRLTAIQNKRPRSRRESDWFSIQRSRDHIPKLFRFGTGRKVRALTQHFLGGHGQGRDRPEQCNPIQQTRRVSVQYSLLTVGPLLPPPIDQWLRASLQTQRHSIGAASLSFALSTRPVVGSLALLLPPLFFLPWDRIADR